MRLTKKNPKTEQQTPVVNEEPFKTDLKKLKLLVTVVNRVKTEFFIDLIASFGVNLQTSVNAKGTARSETLSLLGLEESDKGVIFSVIREDQADEIMRAIDERFQKLRGGKGIAFTIPLSSVIGVAIYRFLSDNRSAS